MSVKSSGSCCAVRGCSTELRLWLDTDSCEPSPRTDRQDRCGQRYRFYRLPSDERARRAWLRNLNLNLGHTERKLHVCSVHFVDKKPTEENPYPTLKLGCDSRVRTSSDGDMETKEEPRSTSNSWVVQTRKDVAKTEEHAHSGALPEDIKKLIVVKEEVSFEWNSSRDSNDARVKRELREAAAFEEEERSQVIKKSEDGRTGGDVGEMEHPTSSSCETVKERTNSDEDDSLDDDDWPDPSSESEADGANSWGESRSSESELDHETLMERLPKEAKQKLAELKFSCNICRERFPGLISLEKHVKIHTREQPFGGFDCNRSKDGLPENNLDKRFECYFCTNRYTRQGDLIRHIRVHTGEKPFDCEVCGKKFSHKTLLRTHMRIHTGEKPFECNVCGKKFSQRANFITHKRVHTGEKPFECSFCGKCFNRGTRFKIHLRVHTGEKPYDCDVCGAQFKERGNLKMHMRVHTGEKPFTCDVCNKKFTRQGNLKRHLKIHSSPSAADDTEKE